MKKRLGKADIFFPVPAALIVGTYQNQLDVATIAWVGMVSSTPPTIAVSFDKTRYTLSLIKESGCFTVNIPSANYYKETDYCGIVSGKEKNKAVEAGFTYDHNTVTKTPIIQECPFSIECKVNNEIQIGNYTMLLGEVIETYIDEDKVLVQNNREKIDIEKVNPLVYCATVREYWQLDKKLGDAFQVGKEIKNRKVSKAESLGYFNDVADNWDTMRNGFFSEEVREKAYRVAAVKQGELAADIGAGTGFLTEGLLQRGLNVIAVDQSNEMLRQMKNKFNGYEELDCRQGDAENLPIDDNTVNYTMANMFLHHVENPEITIKEMVRIMKPGGKLVITDLDEHNHEFLVIEQHDRWKGFKRSDIETWFKQAGLKNIVVDCVGGNCCASSSCSCDSASISIFIAYGEK